MPIVYLGLGSNTQPAHNLRLGVRELSRRFTLIAVSRVYRNAAFGFEGSEFLNAVAKVETDLSAAMIVNELNVIHELAGRRREDSAFSSRTLDIDLLLYGDEVIPEKRLPRSDVLDYSFVLRPLSEIAPDLRHPVTGDTMAEHWQAFDQDSHPLTEDRLILLNGDE